MALRKVYGHLYSPPTQAVLACLFEHDLKFEFVPIDMKAGEHKKQPFISFNPFAQVPAYEDGEFKYFESRAICRSMAHQYGKKGEELIYHDAKAQGIVAAWVDVGDHHFGPPAGEMICELVFKPMKGLSTDQAVVAKAEAKLAKVLDVYEARLIKFKYLATDKYTIVDMIHLPKLQCLVGTPAKKLFDERPHVSAWCADILARPAWAKVMEMKNQFQSCLLACLCSIVRR